MSFHYFFPDATDFNDQKINFSTYNDVKDEKDFELNITYTAFEILVGIIAVIGNLMVIIVFKRDRKLRRRTNYYIVSLAVADFLVGLVGVPFAILSSIGQPKNIYACLISLSTLIILCTISIFCLVAVSVDRYWAILHPMAYSRNVRTKTAIGIISMCWVAGTLVGLMPLFGFHQPYQNSCFFEKTMDYNFLLFLYFATIITPAILMLCFYAHIYRVIVRQIRQIVTMNPIGESSRRSSRSSSVQPSLNYRNHGGTMLRVLGAARKRDVKATQNLSIIVLFFMICWIPLYTINCITAFNRDIFIPDQLKMCCIILTHLNSAINPILYAYHLKDFRAALKNLILKVFGIEVEQPSDLQYRISLASQHRIHSLTDKRTSFQNRIYVDSPVWLKQKQIQQQLQTKRNSAISCSLSSVHQTVAAVASATADINREMWKIIEAPSVANEESYRKTCEDQVSTNKDAYLSSEDEPLSQFSYDNKNFSSSLENINDNDIYIPKQNDFQARKSITLSLIREQLQSTKNNCNEFVLDLDTKSSPNERVSSENNKNNENLSLPRTSSNSTIHSYNQLSDDDDNDNVDNNEANSNNKFYNERNDSPVYHIEIASDTKNISPSLKIISKKKSKLSNNSNNEGGCGKITRSTSCNYDDLNLYHSNNTLENLRPTKVIDNIIYPKHSSLYHIYDYFKEKDDVMLKSARKRTTSAES